MAMRRRSDIPPASRRRAVRALLAALLGLAAASPAAAQTVGDDAMAKARLVTTLVRFIQWPAEAFAGEAAPLQLCVVHESAVVAAAIREELKLPVFGRAWAASYGPRPPRDAACHVFFVDDSAGSAAAGETLRRAAAGQLTVALADGFASRGGMVEIVVVDEMLRFDVNLGALQRAGLGMRAGALKLARTVIRP